MRKPPFHLVLMLGVLSGALAPTITAAAQPATNYYVGTWGNRTVAWSPADFAIAVRGASKPLYSFRQEFFAQFRPDMTCERESSLDVLSVVGPFVSVHRAESGDCLGTAHPYAEQDYHAYDLRAGNLQVTLDAIFPPAQVRRALLGDRLVRRALASQLPKGAPPPPTLASLVMALSGYSSADCRYGFEDDLLTRFAFHHLEGHSVAVRLGLSHGCEANRGHLTQIGLLLPIPNAWRAAFEAAASGKRGFLAVRAPHGATALAHTDRGFPR